MDNKEVKKTAKIKVTTPFFSKEIEVDGFESLDDGDFFLLNDRFVLVVKTNDYVVEYL